MSPYNKQLEEKFREMIKQYSIEKANEFDPYSLSKVVRYLYAYNDGSESAV